MSPSLKPLIMGLCLAVSACGGSTGANDTSEQAAETTAQGIQYGGHLKIGFTTEPTSLDAVLGRSGGDAYYWHQIYDQLVDAYPDLTPRAGARLAQRDWIRRVRPKPALGVLNWVPNMS